MISSGRAHTRAVRGAYWITCIRSFSKITAPGVTARFLPTWKAVSSVIDTRPLARSSKNLTMPSATLLPPVCIASCIASGLVAKKLAGLKASLNCRTAKRIWPLVFSSTGAASTQSRSAPAYAR